MLHSPHTIRATVFPFATIFDMTSWPAWHRASRVISTATSASGAVNSCSRSCLQAADAPKKRATPGGGVSSVMKRCANARSSCSSTTRNVRRGPSAPLTPYLRQSTCQFHEGKTDWGIGLLVACDKKACPCDDSRRPGMPSPAAASSVGRKPLVESPP